MTSENAPGASTGGVTSGLPPEGVILEASHSQGDRKLARKVGTVSIIFVVLAYMAPLGAATGYIPLVIGYGNGLGAPMTYVVVCAALLVFSVGYAALTRHVTNPGAFYAYITAGLGRRMGLGASFLSVFFYLAAGVSFNVYGGIVCASVVHDTFHGPKLHWWVGSLLLTAVVAVLSYRGVEFNARVMGVALIVEASLILAFDVVSLARHGATKATGEVFNPGNLTHTGSFGAAALYVTIFFLGFEACAIFSEEAKEPRRTVARATYATIIVVAVFYFISSWALIAFFGADHAAQATGTDPTGSFLTAVSGTLSHGVAQIISVLILESILASQLSVANVTGRYLYSLSVDKILWSRLARVHARFKAPSSAVLAANAVFLVLLLALVVANVDPLVVYSGIGGGVVLAFLILVLLVSVSIIVYFRRTPSSDASVLATTVAPALSILFIVPMTVYTTMHMDLITGADYSWLGRVLTGVDYALVIAGIAYASWLARRRASVFARIGRSAG